MLLNADNPSVRVMGIVELATQVGDYLLHEDRLSCVKVSKDWNQAFVPALYHDMDDRQGAWPRILKSHDDPSTNNGQDQDWIHTLFKTHGCHIRHLSTQWRIVIDGAYLGQTCTQLKSLSTNNFAKSYTIKELDEYERISEERELTYEERILPSARVHFVSPEFAGAAVAGDDDDDDVDGDADGVFLPMVAGWRTLQQQEQDWLTSQYFWLLARQNLGLKSLTLAWSLNELFNVLPEYVYVALAGLPQLTYLDCRLEGVELKKVLECCPRLETYRSYSTSGFGCFVGHEWPSLQTLQMSMEVHGEELLHLLKGLPGLLNLQLGGIRSSSEECTNVAELLGNRPSRLRKLELTSIGLYVDEWFGTQVLSWLPNLVELSCPVLGQDTARGLVHYCKGFQAYLQSVFKSSIHYSYWSGTTPNVFRHLMEECSDLQVLDGVRHTIEFEGLETNEWVCSGLEKLRCQFVGFSRLTAVEEAILGDEEASVMGSSNQVLEERQRVSREQQKTVLDRLSTFTRLRVLDLGYEFRVLQLVRGVRGHPSAYSTLAQPIPTTMELSLASGLDRLAALKDLEVFGFEGVDHRIGKPELEWMAVNWPKLKVMRGVQEDNIPGEEFRAEKKMLREYFQVLRPDVVHETGPKSSSRV
ncbi:hypothetical protein BGX24_006494 [Mortierella sp. AD032]|nr:hypothetical protein BGX24_006494 [Mortierella sp. AD032]